LDGSVCDLYIQVSCTRFSYEFLVQESWIVCQEPYRSNRLGLSHWDPSAVHRGGCLELSYYDMMEWFWWDSRLISTTNWFPSVLWHCWFGHLACKNQPLKWPIMCWVGCFKASTLVLLGNEDVFALWHPTYSPCIFQLVRSKARQDA